MSPPPPPTKRHFLLCFTSSGPPGLWLAVKMKHPKAFSGPRSRMTADAAGVDKYPFCPIHTCLTLGGWLFEGPGHVRGGDGCVGEEGDGNFVFA